MSCDNRTKAIWIQGTTLKVAKDRCELLKCVCTKQMRKECPFEKEQK